MMNKEKTRPNTPLVTHRYTADPSAHVFNDKIYIYPSHDLGTDKGQLASGDHFKMTDYHAFSMENLDGAPCIDHGQVLHVDDVPWAVRQMWDNDVNTKNGKYYMYFPAKDKDDIFRIGVAIADKPEGPFIPEPNPIEGSYSIDPCVFIDDDNQAYMYFGGLWGGQLERWETGSYDPNIPDQIMGTEEFNGEENAINPKVAILNEDMISFKEAPVDVQILDKSGEPLKAGDLSRRFFEAAWMHKFNGKYYLSYSTGDTHYIVYAEGDNPLGPFTYKGRILEKVIGWTNHHSIVEFKGKWYLFYHDSRLSGGVTQRRNIMYTPLDIAEDGTIKTIDPYADEEQGSVIANLESAVKKAVTNFLQNKSVTE